MPDWYDRLISLLGLDGSRNDVLFGVPVREFPELPGMNSAGGVRPALHRRADGLLCLVFEVPNPGGSWRGILPCTPGNLDLLEAFLGQARLHGTPDGPTDPARPSLGAVVLPDLPDSMHGLRIGLRLAEPTEGPRSLEFTLRGPRALLRRPLRWDRSASQAWETLLQEAREGSGH